MLAKEKIVSIRELQKNPSKALQGVTRIIRNGKSVGLFLSDEMWDELQEDIEMMTSKGLEKRIAAARKQIKKGTMKSLEEVMKEHGIRH